MMVCDITPTRLHFEQHTFNCAECNQVVVTMVEDCKNAALAA
jgi:hypothetical protein